jgi:hypothetical protein
MKVTDSQLKVTDPIESDRPQLKVADAQLTVTDPNGK